MRCALHGSEEMEGDRGKALVISGPSGVGKGSIIALLLTQLGSRVALCISHTTRSARQGEEEGTHYYFTSRQQMERDIQDGLFLEHAEVHGNVYGTSRDALRRIQNAGKIAILDVDVRGAQALRDSGLQALYVFISPPSLLSLEQRLRARGSESEASLQGRLAAASLQITTAAEAGRYDVTIVNNELPRAVADVMSRVQGQLQGRARVVFILGGPGSGKGTQSALLSAKYGHTHLSAGDLLRAECARDTPLARDIQAAMVAGLIVPVEITCSLLQKCMAAHLAQSDAKSETIFLVDGFPRNQDNLDGWKKVIGSAVPIAFVLHLVCPQHVMRERLLERGKSSGRVDDSLDSISKRMKVLEEETMPVIKELETLGLVRHCQGDQGAEEVFAEVEAVFAQELPPLLFAQLQKSERESYDTSICDMTDFPSKSH
eukprot:CAMPEP_0179438288 /NCGR_PEP_ID=MMETSP0799-20121207/22043_1 /TAXON_ID=46947 /ORGANISM="Geminigera cryophila, Strain CCMP2564" /LENGTH=430 /DNA_ID=CAMNT_0021219799 /DNA_START=575 /DNA_END=1867 /DNA_ORIENTATION=+